MRDNLLSSLPEEIEGEPKVSAQREESLEADEGELRRDFLAEDFRDLHPNIYEAIVIMSQRARQIGLKQGRIVEQFIASKARPDDYDDDEEEVYRSLEDDDEESPKLPKLEKPTVTAMNEMYRGVLKYNQEEK